MKTEMTSLGTCYCRMLRMRVQYVSITVIDCFFGSLRAPNELQKCEAGPRTIAHVFLSTNTHTSI